MNEPAAIGFDIGGSTTKVGIVRRSGEILAFERMPTDIEQIGREKFLANFLAMIHGVRAQADEGLSGIGGTFAGWIDEARSGPFICLNAPSLHGLNLRKILLDEFGPPVALIDDTNAHALAEYTFGSGRGYRRFMNLAMGTGLSSGVILNGQMLQFTGGCVGDTGHLILRPGGPACSGGCKGCAEALIGVKGIERLGSQVFGRPVSAYEIIQLARTSSDVRARAVMREIGGYVGELLASLSHIFLPERISLSGGTANAGETLLQAARQRFEDISGDYHRNYVALADDYYHGVDIVLSELKGEPGLIGSAVHLFNQISTNESEPQ